MFPCDILTLAVVDCLQLDMSLAYAVKYDLLHDISGKQDRYEDSGDASRLPLIGGGQILVELVGPHLVYCIFIFVQS